MIRTIITVLGLMGMLSSLLPAETLRASYDVSYGIFGKVGTAKAQLQKEHGHYRIDIRLAATGLAASLSGNRKEFHHSEGHIKNGVLVSDLYRVIREYRSTRVVKEYRIDHQRRKVSKVYKKYKKGKLVDTQQKMLDFYAPNDLLTLYFDLDRLIPDKHKSGTYTFSAVGAEKQQGRVTVILPPASKVAQYRNDLHVDAAWYATAVIHQKIFMSKEGRLELAVGKDGITEAALLKDLILFGDIYAVRKE